MKTLSDIIDYASAPLVQWEPAIGEAPSDGKKCEDILTHGAIITLLNKMRASKATSIIADEARLEIEAAWVLPNMKKLTHLTLSGAFEKAATHNLTEARRNGIPRTDRIVVTSDADAVKPRSQDAVVMNMILGCLATAEDHNNLHKMLCFAATLLRPSGKLIMVRPNPEGGVHETYRCTTPANQLEGGKDYGFIVNGLEDLGEMKNLYTPDDFLAKHMEAAGFDLGPTRGIVGNDVSWKSPFLINVSSLKP